MTGRNIMAREKLSIRIKQGPFILDGAMGTQLMDAGVPAGVCNDYLNIDSPEIVVGVHSAYIQASSDAIITNTFGANKITLARHGHSGKVSQINLAAGQIARKAAGADRFVLGDIGSCGDFLEPLGLLKADDLKDAFCEQAKALADGGVDGFIIETMTDLQETVIAIEAVKSAVGEALPLFVSLSYDIAGDGFKTMMAVEPAAAIEKIASLGVDVIGFNCGTLTMDEYIKLAQVYATSVGDKDIAILAEPNAGKPQLDGQHTVYNLAPEDFANAAVDINSAGVTILGGCCGTTPAHIQAMAEKIKG
jgi:5-methyltetrahydrofolate--homocysteine methyltransferase